MLAGLIIFAFTGLAGAAINSVKFQIIPLLLGVMGPSGSIFNETSCPNKIWQYSLRLHQYDLMCQGTSECLLYEQLGYQLYFQPVPFEILGSYQQISAKLMSNRTIWLNLRLEQKDGQQQGEFYDFNFPIKIDAKTTVSGSKQRSLNENFQLEVASKMLGREVNASMSCSILIVCDGFFVGNRCQSIDCGGNNGQQQREIIQSDTGWEKCQGSGLFEEDLESHYKSYRKRLSGSDLFATESSPEEKEEKQEKSFLKMLGEDRNFFIILVALLTVFALAESLFILGYFYKSFKKKSSLRRR